MAIRIVRLGTPRHPDEGPRLGTVRRPPRGVPKSEFASRDWYDLWFPTLAPSAETMALGQAAQAAAAAGAADAERAWATFTRRYRAEMAQPQAAQAVALLALLSHGSNFSVGCYCEHEAQCHRGLLRRLLADAGATLAEDPVTAAARR